MDNGTKAFKFGAAFAAFGIVLSSTAHAAPRGFTTADPLLSLSVFGTSSSRAAVCAAGAANAAATAGAAAAAAATQPGPGAGCVLPVLDPVPPPVVQTPMAVPPAMVGSGFGFGALLPLLAVAALGTLAVLLLDDGDNDMVNPVSPF